MMLPHRITPFGYPGVNGYVLLTPAFRSLSRPSSPYSSQASTINLYSLDHIISSALLQTLSRFKGFFPCRSSFPFRSRLFKRLPSSFSLPLLLSVLPFAFQTSSAFPSLFMTPAPGRLTDQRKKQLTFLCVYTNTLFPFLKRR